LAVYRKVSHCRKCHSKYCKENHKNHYKKGIKMLVLNRKKEESIVIGQEDNLAEIKIVDIRGNNVRLGIMADKSILVHRKEIYEAVQKGKTK